MKFISLLNISSLQIIFMAFSSRNSKGKGPPDSGNYSFVTCSSSLENRDDSITPVSSTNIRSALYKIQTIRLYLNLFIDNICMYSMYKHLKKRLESFLLSQYPHTKPNLHELSICGFFYIGPHDVVQCFMCGCKLTDWEREDLPLEEHYRSSPHCKFVILQRLERGLLTETETDALYEESKCLSRLGRLCEENYPPFRICVELGHDKDVMLHVLSRRFVLNQFEMISITTKELIEAVIETSINLDEEELQSIQGLYKSLVQSIAIIQGHTDGNITAHSQSTIDNPVDLIDGATAFNAEISFDNLSSSRDRRESIERIKEENIEMIVQNLCRLCEEAIADIVVLPCGHISMCYSCSIKRKNVSNCPKCDSNMNDSIRVFRS